METKESQWLCTVWVDQWRWNFFISRPKNSKINISTLWSHWLEPMEVHSYQLLFLLKVKAYCFSNQSLEYLECQGVTNTSKNIFFKKVFLKPKKIMLSKGSGTWRTFLEEKQIKHYFWSTQSNPKSTIFRASKNVS